MNYAFALKTRQSTTPKMGLVENQKIILLVKKFITLKEELWKSVVGQDNQKQIYSWIGYGIS